MVAMGLSRSLSRRVRHVVVRALVGAAVVAAIGYAVPHTLFSGRGELESILEGGAALTAGLLLTTMLFGLQLELSVIPPWRW